MARAVHLRDATARAAGATYARAANQGSTHGHYNGSVTAKFNNAGGGAARVLTVKGTNDPNDTTGETLATINAGANGFVSGSWANKAYKYVFWTLDAGTALDVAEVNLYLSGFAGTE